jgi:chemotaxis family two-component system sensor kinase Cph1
VNIDLTNCDLEPIHIPGKIQGHGFLIVINKQGNICFHSENALRYLDINGGPEQLLGRHINSIESLIGRNEPPDFINQLIALGKTNGFEQTNPFNTDINGSAFHLIISTSDDYYLLEFEPARSDSHTDIQRMIGQSISTMLADKNLHNLLHNSASQVKNVIGYDRVMVYRFADDGHGEVIAEAKNDNLPSWMGLHYPASDIPKQARDLYKKNLTRLIANVNAAPSNIVTTVTEGPLDLTNSQLRAVSPIHIQYLINMGVQSSFSISLLYKNELWGLIACHSYSPRFIDFRSRESAKLIGQILSSALEFRQDEENQLLQQRYKNAVDQLSRLMLKDNEIEFALTGNVVNLLDAVDARGAVLVFENNITKLGVTPNDDEINSLVGWLKANVTESLWYTTKLSAEYPQAISFKKTASGVMVSTLSRELGEYVIWFKPELLQTITWAGNPEKPAEVSTDGKMLHISPRNSFEEWSQTVTATSKSWGNEEVKSAVRLRSEITYAINQKAGAIRLLNEKLKQAYEELDTFSFTISHDLKNPLSTIKSYAQILMRDKELKPSALKVLERINSGADKMNNMISEVLDYSRIGRAELVFSEINTRNLISDIVKDLALVYNVDESCFVIGDTPPIQGDPVMILQVLSNVISNAIKYSMPTNAPKVNISGVVNENEVVYTITDNGLGIDIKQLPRIFELFNRMDNVGDIEGSGVGLSIVKRIVEKHKGKIWVDSELGSGSSFHIAFNK